MKIKKINKNKLYQKLIFKNKFNKNKLKLKNSKEK